MYLEASTILTFPRIPVLPYSRGWLEEGEGKWTAQAPSIP